MVDLEIFRGGFRFMEQGGGAQAEVTEKYGKYTQH